MNHVPSLRGPQPPEEEHSRLAPSFSGAWSVCPGAVNLIESLGVKSSTSPAAAFGTLCHKVAAAGLMFLFHNGPLPEYPKDPDEADKVKAVVEPYTMHVLEGSEEHPACNHRKQWKVWIEQRFQLRLIHPDVWGTGDCIVYCPVCCELRVIDLKSGGGTEVEAHENSQLSIYGLLSLFEYPLGPVNSLRIEISCPRAPSGQYHKVWRPPVAALLDWLPWIQERAKATEAKDAPLVAGDHCKQYFCPALGVCPAWRKHVTALAAEGFRKPRAEQIKLDMEYLVQILTWAPALQELIESAHSIAYTAACQGVPIPGFKIVQQRDGNRTYIDQDQAREVLVAWARENGKDESKVMKTPAVNSPAQIEAAYGKAVKPVLSSLVTRKEGGTVLVPESHKSPAVTSSADPKQIFGAPGVKKPVVKVCTDHAKEMKADGRYQILLEAPCQFCNQLVPGKEGDPRLLL